MKNFFSKFKGWAHAVAGLAVTAATVYATNSEVQHAINTLLASNKKTAGFVTALSGIVLAYSNGKAGN